MIEESNSVGMILNIYTLSHSIEDDLFRFYREIQSSSGDLPVNRDAATQRSRLQFSTTVASKDEETDSLSTEVLERIQSKIQAKDLGRLFAVVHIDGHQRKITTEDIIVLHKHIEADIGERILINKVMLVGGKDFTLVGRPVLSPQFVKVEASVLEKTLSQTIISSWYRKRRNVKKLHLRKIQFTMLRINTIELSLGKEL